MNDRPFDVISIKSRITADNDAIAAEVRNLMKEKKIFFMNLMASPGAGKTTTLVRTINSLKDKYRIGVIEADVDSTVDAQAIHETGVKVIQVHNGGSCHMDAGTTRKGLFSMDLDGIKLAFLENVGNLICPAEFDTGAHVNMMILSVPEGDDKPLKYPLMFRESQVLVITKTDALPYFTFDLEKCRKRALTLNPNIKIFPVSAKTGEGMEDLENWLGSLII